MALASSRRLIHSPSRLACSSARLSSSPFRFHLSALALACVVLLWSPSSGSGSMVADAACARSTLKGYNYSVPLSTRFSSGGLKLHWRVSGKKLFAALQALPSSGATTGWISVGWSPDGRMDNSDAVVGNLGGSKPVKAYYMVDQRSISTTSAFSIGSNPRVVKNSAGLFVIFARAAGTGNVPVRLSGSSNIIFAFSEDNSKSFRDHGPNFGAATVNFSCK